MYFYIVLKLQQALWVQHNADVARDEIEFGTPGLKWECP